MQGEKEAYTQSIGDLEEPKQTRKHDKLLSLVAMREEGRKVAGFGVARRIYRTNTPSQLVRFVSFSAG